MGPQAPIPTDDTADVTKGQGHRSDALRWAGAAQEPAGVGGTETQEGGGSPATPDSWASGSEAQMW